MIDQAGLWAGTGVLCAVLVILIVFALYKQHFGSLALPERKIEAETSTDAKKATATDEDLPPPPYPAVDGEGPTAFVYEHPVEDSEGVTVEVHGQEASCHGEPEPKSPHVYEQTIQLETST